MALLGTVLSGAWIQWPCLESPRKFGTPKEYIFQAKNDNKRFCEGKSRLAISVDCYDLSMFNALIFSLTIFLLFLLKSICSCSFKNIVPFLISGLEF